MFKTIASTCAVLLMLLSGLTASAEGVTIAVFIPGVLQGSPTYELLDAGVRKAAAEVSGTTVKTIEGGYNQAQWGEQIAALAATGDYKYIVTSNPAMPEIAAKAALAFPQQRFLILDSYSKNPSYATVLYNYRELSFLHGVLGGLLAAEKKAPPVLGLIAGQEYPDMNNAIVPGFAEGLKSISADGRVEFRVVGNWYDAAKGSELAKGLFDQKIAVVLPIAGGANQGVITAAKSQGKAVLWYDVDGYALEPGVIVGSGRILQDKAAYELTKSALQGSLTFGAPRVVGVKDGYVDYLTASTAYQKAVSAAVRKSFEAILADFKSGKKHLEAVVPKN